MRRYTFVVQVHPEGISTLENLSTHERIPLSGLDAVGPQIERWLAEPPGRVSSARTRSEPSQSESAPG
jgi:hypothetical protein